MSGDEPDREAAGVPGAARGGEARASGPEIALQLKGRLPCFRCGYDLGGLSIREVCPECGTPIRATLLVVVDPHARELQPLRRAWLVVAGLLAWSIGGLAAAIVGWWVWAAPFVGEVAERTLSAGWVKVAGAGCSVVCGVGAIALVRPHARIPRAQVVGAAAGVVGTFVLAAVSYWIWTRYPVRVVADIAPEAESSLLRLAECGVLALVIVLLRPNARMLEARSLLLRSGRVDRQTMYAMAAAVGVVAAGHVVNLAALWLSGKVLDSALIAGTVLVAVGWMLVTIGLVGVLLDIVRLCPVLLEPSPTLGSLLAGERRR